MSGLRMKTPLRVILLAFAPLAGCQRTDHIAPVEPPGNPLPATVSSSNTSQTTAPTEAQPTCLVPLSESPPPAAKVAVHCPTAPNVAPPLRHGTVKFLGGNQASIDVELALSLEEQQLGLMYRTELPTGSGMLFSWSNESIHTFWMHNTCLPLDMLFITADGTITGILEQVPVLNDEPRSIPCPTAHVLEVNAGYCRKYGIKPGQRVRIKTT